jgi:hypothetical protein
MTKQLNVVDDRKFTAIVREFTFMHSKSLKCTHWCVKLNVVDDCKFTAIVRECTTSRNYS